MNDKTLTIAYFASKGLLTALMLFSAGMYLFAHGMAVEAFTALGYPTYLVYPLAIAKLLGLAAIWGRFSEMLKEWAYAGFFFDLLLAVAAHLHAGDNEFLPALLGLVFVVTAVFCEKRRDRA